MLRTLLIVGTGGFIGSVMRYLVQIFVEKGLSTTFPWGTFVANIAGSFIIGIVFAFAESIQKRCFKGTNCSIVNLLAGKAVDEIPYLGNVF